MLTHSVRTVAGLLAAVLLFSITGCREAGSTPDVPAVSTADLTADLEAVIARHPEATVAVAVRDAATGTDLDLRADRSFHAASTMKVPVMIEVFRQAALGRFHLDDSLAVENDFRSIVDGSPYRIEDDSDDAIYEVLGTKMAVRDLVESMITVSSNLATNLLIAFVPADSVQATAERLGAADINVLRGVEDIKAFRQGLNNTTTAADLAALLAALRDGRAVSPEADREMVEILLGQRFDTMIPAGLPEDVRVAHKTGWITEVHHDAAIVYPAEAAPYVLVVLTEGIADAKVSAALGAEIARTVHAAVRPGA